MMLLCNDGWHEMMLFICSGGTYLVFIAWDVRGVSLLHVLSAAVGHDQDVQSVHKLESYL